MKSTVHNIISKHKKIEQIENKKGKERGDIVSDKKKIVKKVKVESILST